MRHTRRSVLGLGAGVLALSGCLDTQPTRYDPVPGRSPATLAHRGSMYLWPENTLVAIRNAIDTGADIVEIDVDRTADGELVLFHDDTLDRTTDGSGPVGERTLAELRELDAAYEFPPTEFEEFSAYGADHEHVPAADGHPYRGAGIRIPTLGEVFEAVPREYPLLLDVKPGPSVAEVAAHIEAFDRVDSTLVAGFRDEFLRQLRDELPGVATGLAPVEGGRILLTNRATEHRYEPPAEFLFPPHGMTRDGLVERAHRNGLSVFPWSVNATPEVRRLASAGVDGLVTDDHIHTRSVLAAMNRDGV
jgi:glycerophosphoryl diester phosphodiesterase